MKLFNILTLMVISLLLMSGLSMITQSRLPDYDEVVIQNDHNKIDKMYVLVNSSIYSFLKDELSVYRDDVENLKGIEVEVYENTYSDPQQIRSFLRDGYKNDGLVGTFFVGNLPYAQYEMDYSPEYYYRFPIDFYYMDVDGSWIDSDDDGYFDDHTHGSSNLWPDIWFGRICMKTGWEEEISLYENYFDKVHKYRMGELTLPHKALHYVDDDWVNWTDEYSMGLKDLYPDTTLVNDKEITNATDYGKRLHEGYEWIQIHCHANRSAKRHAFKLDDGPKGSGGNFTSRDLYEEGQRSLFANIFTCGSANYTASNYLCGWYALTEEYGLANVGTTKSGSMLNFEDYYEPILEGKNLGESLQEWMRENVEDNRWWFYGMTTIGDPTLSPGYFHEGDDSKEYIPHAPIRIDDDTDLAQQAQIQRWEGSGTETEPYIIEGYGIDGDGSGNCIYIGNTTDHFVIKDCYLHESNGNKNDYHRNTGIILNNVENGKVYNNTFYYNHQYDIYIKNSKNIVVSKNKITTSLEEAVVLDDGSQDNIIKENNISSSNGPGVHLIRSDGNKLIDNIISNNGCGFLLEGSDDNYLTCNNVSSNYGDGVRINASSDNEIKENTVISNEGHGVFLKNSNGNFVGNNTFTENKLNGIAVSLSEKSRIEFNELTDNRHGVLLNHSRKTSVFNNVMINDSIAVTGDQLSYWNTHSIDNTNTINDKQVYYFKNKEGGKVPTDAGQVLLANCTGVDIQDLNLSTGSNGLSLGYSNENNVFNNTISNNYMGISLYRSSRNRLINNKASDNEYVGISLGENSDNNILKNNSIKFNGEFGIKIFSESDDNKLVNNKIRSNNGIGVHLSGKSGQNEIHHNKFIDNDIQAHDCCQLNRWYNETLQEGNYWSDYNGTDTDGDGIGDTPYFIIEEDDIVDRYPLMEHIPFIPKDTTPPNADAGEDITVKVGQEFTLDASDSSDNEGIQCCEWDLDNGETKSGEECTYKFEEPGEYTIELTVTDEVGNADTDTVTVTVEQADDTDGDGDDSDETPGFTLIILLFSLSLVALYRYRKKKR